MTQPRPKPSRGAGRQARGEAVQDARDARDAAVRGQEPHARQADEDAAEQRGEGVKFSMALTLP
jgi:hypothetical protein